MKEEKKLVPVAMSQGRFQPYTLGHLKLAQKAWKDRKLKTVLFIINTPENKRDKKHPFSTDSLLDMYHRLIKDSDLLVDILVTQSADIVKNAELAREHGYELHAWCCGTDRKDDFTRMADHYHDKASLPDDFEVLEVPRTDADISATAARQCLLDGDVKGFKAITPEAVGKEFFRLKKLIEEVVPKEQTE